MVFLAIDEVATQLEAPFGRDGNAIDFERMLRRIDKHTAAQLSLRLRRTVARRGRTRPSGLGSGERCLPCASQVLRAPAARGRPSSTLLPAFPCAPQGTPWRGACAASLPGALP